MLSLMDTPKKFTMTDDHKNKLAAGREESRFIKSYLEAVAGNRPKRGRKRTPESIDKRLADIEKTLPTSTPLKRLNLVQERLDLQEERKTLTQEVDLSAVEADFVKVAKDYGERKGISYAAWRELGVDAAVLTKAGITRAS